LHAVLQDLNQQLQQLQLATVTGIAKERYVVEVSD
jgi:hypothetical protein